MATSDSEDDAYKLEKLRQKKKPKKKEVKRQPSEEKVIKSYQRVSKFMRREIPILKSFCANK